MQVSELKFLLKLLGQENYRASISQLYRTEKTPAKERNRICRDLAARDLVAYSRNIKQFRISAAGRALLQIKDAPLTKVQRQVMQACAAESIVPSAIKQPNGAERQAVIQELNTKGYIKVEQEQINQVWLTERGCDYLRYDCQPSGNSSISLNLLRNYLAFLRKDLDNSMGETNTGLTDGELLQGIQRLDQTYQTNNYLPIFHLRHHFEAWSREHLDQALYRLQRQDQIELSSLQNSEPYTAEQIEAGIPEPAGGLLFFISLL